MIKRSEIVEEIKEAVDNLTDENAKEVLEIIKTYLRIQRRLRRSST